jgi:hypothetical protein
MQTYHDKLDRLVETKVSLNRKIKKTIKSQNLKKELTLINFKIHDLILNQIGDKTPTNLGIYKEALFQDIKRIKKKIKLTTNEYFAERIEESEYIYIVMILKNKLSACDEELFIVNKLVLSFLDEVVQ